MSFSRDDLLARARALEALKRWKDAIVELERAVALDPGDATAYCHMAVCHLELRDLDQALACADEAVRHEPDSEWGHRLRAVALLRMGKAKRALVAAEESVRLAPIEPFALQTLFAIQTQLKRTKEAAETAELLARLRPDEPETHTNLALIAIKRSKWKDAERHCRAALAIDPRHTDAINNLGVALLNQRRHREAIVCFYQALTTRPTHALARNNLRMASQRYLHPVGVGLVALFILRFLLGAGDNAWVVAGTIAVAVLAGWLWRRHRLQSLPDEVRDAIRAERERTEWRRVFLALFFLLTCAGSIVWGITMIFDPTFRPTNVAAWLWYSALVAGMILSAIKLRAMRIEERLLRGLR